MLAIGSSPIPWDCQLFMRSRMTATHLWIVIIVLVVRTHVSTGNEEGKYNRTISGEKKERIPDQFLEFGRLHQKMLENSQAFSDGAGQTRKILNVFFPG